MDINLSKYNCILFFLYLFLAAYNLVFYSTYSADQCKSEVAVTRILPELYSEFLPQTNQKKYENDIDEHKAVPLDHTMPPRQLANSTSNSSNSSNSSNLSNSSNSSNTSSSLSTSSTSNTTNSSNSNNGNSGTSSSSSSSSTNSSLYQTVVSSTTLSTVPFVIGLTYITVAGLSMFAACAINWFSHMLPEKFASLGFCKGAVGCFIRNNPKLMRLAHYVILLLIILQFVFIFTVKACQTALHVNGEVVTVGEMYDQSIVYNLVTLCFWGAMFIGFPFIKAILPQEAFIYEPYDSDIGLCRYVFCSFLGPN